MVHPARPGRSRAAAPRSCASDDDDRGPPPAIHAEAELSALREAAQAFTGTNGVPALPTADLPLERPATPILTPGAAATTRAHRTQKRSRPSQDTVRHVKRLSIQGETAAPDAIAHDPQGAPADIGHPPIQIQRYPHPLRPWRSPGARRFRPFRAHQPREVRERGDEEIASQARSARAGSTRTVDHSTRSGPPAKARCLGTRTTAGHDLVGAAGARRPREPRAVHLLVKGAIVQAAEGDRQAAQPTKTIARLVLEQHR